MQIILNKKFAKILILAGFLALFLFINNYALAQPGVCNEPNCVSNPLQAKTFADFIKGIANIVAMIGGVVAVIFIIWAGFLFVTARGDVKQIEQAKSTFMWTVIGTAILLGAYIIASALVNLVQGLGAP